MTFSKTIRIAVLLGVLCCAAAHARAASVSWDPTGSLTSTGSGSGGSGTWDTGTSYNWWLSGTADSQWTDTTGVNTAVFGGAAGTVTVSGNNAANAITFNTAGYTLSGGTVDVGWHDTHDHFQRGSHDQLDLGGRRRTD